MSSLASTLARRVYLPNQSVFAFNADKGLLTFWQRALIQVVYLMMSRSTKTMMLNTMALMAEAIDETYPRAIYSLSTTRNMESRQ